MDAGSTVIENDALRQKLLETLTSGNAAAAASLPALLMNALSPEQQAMFNMVLAMNGDRTASAASGEAVVLPDDETAAMRQELEDLREVNDTVAAALGACRFCWGGDGDCLECGGRGRAGSRAPHPRLFGELVAPAVRRVADRERNVRRMPGRPAHMDRNAEVTK